MVSNTRPSLPRPALPAASVFSPGPGSRPTRRPVLAALVTAPLVALATAHAWAATPASTPTAATSAATSAATPAAITVATAVVGSQSSGTRFEAEGTLQALLQSTVSARVGGAVLQLAVKAGQPVKAGQLLARLDDRDLQAAVAASDAAVAQAQAAHTQAQQQLQRQRELRAQGFLSAAALDSATAQAQATAAAVQQAQAMRQQAALARGFTNVTAPFEGVVLATLVEAGELATPGRPLLTLYAPGKLRAVVQLPSGRAAAARAATLTEVLLPDGQRVVPINRQEMPGADAVAQTTEWRLDLPASAQAPASLQPGQAVRVSFVGASPAAAEAAAPARLSVPASAVLRRGELQAVYVAQQGHFVLKTVRLGATSGSAGSAQQEVLAGLKSGERIALDPVRAGLAGAVPAAAP